MASSWGTSWGTSWASSWGTSGGVTPVYGDPQITRTVLAASRRIGGTPDEDNADRIGDAIVATTRRIGGTLQ